MIGTPKPNLLVVDDDPAILELIAVHLADDFKVVALDDAQQAAQLVREKPFDLHLYDVCMDAFPGIELLIWTLATSGGGPVVLMTGSPSIETAVQALKAGAEDLLLKPIDFATLATSLTGVLDRSRRHSSNRHERLEAVHEALTRAVEAKDPTTHGHGDRVRALCRAMGRSLGVNPTDQATLDQAAALHDIGKIGVPDAVLCKPGPLTPDEFRLIQRHPEVGARILEPIPDLVEVRRCVLEHHEKWDGSGYPRGLREDEVSIAGRVLIIAEVFDALAHPRCYKPAWEKQKIEAYFREHLGRHFDPEVGRCFLEILLTEFDELVQPQTLPAI